MSEAHVSNTAHLRGLTERVAHLEGEMLAVVQVLHATDKRITALEGQMTDVKKLLADLTAFLRKQVL